MRLLSMILNTPEAQITSLFYEEAQVGEAPRSVVLQHLLKKKETEEAGLQRWCLAVESKV